VHLKCAGLTDEQARRAPSPGSPLTNISSLVSHLRWVEYYWIRVVLLGEPSRSPTAAAHPDDPVTLRWILFYLIEEIARHNARHNGHLDVLREMADGATGR
jgi:uncharacterized damage-inducible protein DinB